MAGVPLCPQHPPDLQQGRPRTSRTRPGTFSSLLGPQSCPFSSLCNPHLFLFLRNHMSTFLSGQNHPPAQITHLSHPKGIVLPLPCLFMLHLTSKVATSDAAPAGGTLPQQGAALSNSSLPKRPGHPAPCALATEGVPLPVLTSLHPRLSSSPPPEPKPVLFPQDSPPWSLLSSH